MGKELGGINNPRILNIKLKTLRWGFRVVYVPGKDHHVANAMSMYPVETPIEENW